MNKKLTEIGAIVLAGVMAVTTLFSPVGQVKAEENRNTFCMGLL